jgi:predicted DCC family thiol-disulfide oxidoreductase YuxK
VAVRPPAVTVLYDDDCGFCRWSVAKLLAWDRRARVRPVAIQSVEGQRLLAGLAPERRLATAHAVDAAGRLTSGGDALAPVASVLPGGAPLAALARAAPGLARAGYRLVAERRSALARAIPASAKRRADERLRQRIASST